MVFATRCQEMTISAFKALGLKTQPVDRWCAQEGTTTGTRSVFGALCNALRRSRVLNGRTGIENASPAKVKIRSFEERSGNDQQSDAIEKRLIEEIILRPLCDERAIVNKVQE